jgi:hypothetical protein
MPMKRYIVLFALFILSLITYLDRACISSAKGPVSADLSLIDQQIRLRRSTSPRSPAG